MSAIRVLHVIATGRRRGAEVFASDLARYLATQGVQQRVAVLRGVGSDLDFGVSLDRLSARTDLGGLDARVAMRLRRVIGETAPTIVQAHGGEALKYAAASGSRAHVVYRRIGVSSAKSLRPTTRVMYSILMRRTDAIVTVAQRVRDETVQIFHQPPGKVVTIPNGVDRRRIAPTWSREDIRQKLGLALDAPVLISVGSLSWEKDPFAHLEVVSRIRAHLPRLRHLVVGDGPLHQSVEQRIEALGLQGVSTLLGSRADIGDLMAASDALLFASRPDGMEGMPAVVIEASMLGIPTVGFDVAGVGEVVQACGIGRLVAWGDLAGLSSACVSVLSDAAHRSRRSGVAKAHVFDIVSVGDRYLELYGRLAA